MKDVCAIYARHSIDDREMLERQKNLLIKYFRNKFIISAVGNIQHLRKCW